MGVLIQQPPSVASHNLVAQQWHQLHFYYTYALPIKSEKDLSEPLPSLHYCTFFECVWRQRMNYDMTHNLGNIFSAVNLSILPVIFNATARVQRYCRSNRLVGGNCARTKRPSPTIFITKAIRIPPTSVQPKAFYIFQASRIRLSESSMSGFVGVACLRLVNFCDARDVV